MIQLLPMNPEQFIAFRELSMREYAAEKIQSGDWSKEDAPELAEESFQRYLPEGLNTKGAHIYHIYRQDEEQEPIGHLWIHVDDAPAGKLAFIYDILLYEAFQNQGYGQQTMQALEHEMREQQVQRIGLHVFGHNDRAVHVYQKSGYVITDYTMAKIL
ncbi:GNAT family N-acetyltransferase [Paenibacillus kandeliae]|uniref:GNAT family N-acetyltransferase n=1 Tax=Paenibacillus kandeliae TaxID=3231269 RepID=UPI003459886B